jgi:hypothetical protein
VDLNVPQINHGTQIERKSIASREPIMPLKCRTRIGKGLRSAPETNRLYQTEANVEAIFENIWRTSIVRSFG